MKKDRLFGDFKVYSLYLPAVLLICLVVMACGYVSAATNQIAPVDRYSLVYFDGHMHTVESDGTGTMDDVKTAALNQGLSAVIVTNHANELTPEEWMSLNKKALELSENGFLMLNGFEITGSESLFNRDHVLAWNTADPFVGPDSDALAPDQVWESPFNPYGTGPLYPENITKWVEYIHSQGGIAVHAHTTGTTIQAYGVDLIEIFNRGYVKDVAFYASLLGLPPDQCWELGLTMNNMAIYGERDLSMMVTLPGMPYPVSLRYAIYIATLELTGTGLIFGAPEDPLRSWDEILMSYVNKEIDHPIFGVANTDAHNTGNLSPDGDYSDVGKAKNGVYIQGNLTKGTLLSAVKAGRFFATTGPSIDFTVNGRMMGETANVKKGSADLALSVKAESAGAILAKVVIIKNGETLQTLAPMTDTLNTTISDTVDEDGYYRVEVISVNIFSGEYQFAYSNPIFVRK